MTFSPDWTQSVVVHSEGSTIVVPRQSSLSACAPAVADGPIIVRRRDPRLFTAFAPGDHSEKGGNLLRLSSLVSQQDVAETFWIPDPKRNEVSLLEALYRRTRANRTYVLLHSRPLPELQFNFSTCTGDNIDLSHNVFRLSKASMAIMQMERNLSDGDEILLREDVETGGFGSMKDGGKRRIYTSSQPSCISGKFFKDQIRCGLRSIQEEEYYLVRYRDYSTWAVNHYSEIAKKDHFWGKKYVEQCFAVHVGKEPGELIPITEPQFLFGVELLQRQLLERVGVCEMTDLNYCALGKDQFRSLGVVLGDGMRDVGVDGEERLREAAEEERRRAANSHAGAYIPPSMWDWSPSAIKKRIDHQLQLRYQALGRFVVRSTIFGVAVYVTWSYFFRGIVSDENGAQRRGYRARRGYKSGEDAGAFWSNGFLRSVFLGPKDVFDYLLAPANYA